MSKRITITLDDGEYKIFNSVKGSNRDSTKAKMILMAYLFEKTFVKDASMKK